VQAVPTWWDGSPVSQTLDAVLYKGQTMPEKNRFPAVLQPVAFTQNSRDEVRLINGDGQIAGTLSAEGGTHQTNYIAQSVALRGRDGGATAELGGEAAYALRASDGGGSDPYVLAPVVCVTGDVTHTLKAEGFDASEDGTGRGQPIVAFDTYNQSTSDVTHTLRNPNGTFGDALPAVFNGATMAVRRLMPIECHYLQGFPGDWCAVLTGPKGDKIAADGPQYKQLGNSWAVNHARWVGYRIAAWLAANPSRPVIEMEFDENLLMWALAA